MKVNILGTEYTITRLNDSAFAYDRAWAQNEEMVDWIAWQGAKLYEAWRAADAL